MPKTKMHGHYSVCRSDALNNAKCKPNVEGPKPQVVKQRQFQIFSITKSPIKRAFCIFFDSALRTSHSELISVARYVLYTSVASLVTRSRPRRHHYSERGLPLCLNTFRAFLQLSFLLKARPKRSGFPSFTLVFAAITQKQPKSFNLIHFAIVFIISHYRSRAV